MFAQVAGQAGEGSGAGEGQGDGGQHQAGAVGGRHQKGPRRQVAPPDIHPDPAGVAVVEYQADDAEAQQDDAGPDAYPLQGQEGAQGQQGRQHYGQRGQMPGGDVRRCGVQLRRTLPLQRQGHGEQPAHSRVEAVKDAQRRQAQPGAQ